MAGTLFSSCASRILLAVLLFSSSLWGADYSIGAFSVDNPAACETTGDCLFRVELSVDGLPYVYSPADGDLYFIELQYSDLDRDGVRLSYRRLLGDCIAEGVCEAVTGGFLLRHTYLEPGNFFVTVFLGDRSNNTLKANLGPNCTKGQNVIRDFC